MLDYLPEATNNRDIIYNKIRECGNIEVACVYCNLFYVYTNTRDINTCDGHTVTCNKCNVDCIVPITNQSKLVTDCKTRIEMNELLNEWHKDGFSILDDEKDYELIVNRLEIPFVIKPCSQGSSIGVFIIKEKKDFKEKLKELLQFNDWIIAEKYYKGSEYTAGLLNGEVLPLVKINASNEEFYNYEAKYFSEDTTYICPSQLAESIESKVKETCSDVFNLFNINSWGRLDFFINDDNQPVFLELNTVPGMTSHSLVPMAAKEVGINFDNLCLEILRTSID